MHSYERGDLQTAITKTAGNSNTTTLIQSQLLNRRQLIIHEVIMTLNLAIQASNMREQDQLASYLTQARTQLQTLTAKQPTTQKLSTPAKPKLSTKKNDQEDLSETNLLDSMDAPNNIAEVIIWLDKLLANAPVPTPLVTAQILEQPKSNNDN